MMDIKITGNFPTVNTDAMRSTMEFAEQIMLASVQLNLTMGGRPAFNVKRANSTPLMGTGKMYRGVQSSHDDTSATVFMSPDVVSKDGFFYPAALNNGADIPEVTGKLMVFELDGHTVFTQCRRAFRLGPFPFFIFQDVDKKRILEKLLTAMFLQNGKTIQ
jgi:phage gpG-like protein